MLRINGRKKGLFIRLISVALIFSFLFLIPQESLFGARALYNDAKIDEYENMRDKGGVIKYVVPNLFKNDVAFGNVKKFPLVVQNSVEYIPLEMFVGLSSVELNTGLGNGNFYITNIADKSFISFDVVNNLVNTHEKRTYPLETKIFYSTRYVPAKEVASVLGLTCEVYDSLTDGIYALRLSDSKAKLTFKDLIIKYSPVKIVKTEPLEPVITVPEDKPLTQTNPSTPTESVIGNRTIYFTFEACPNEYTGRILDILEKYNIKATFFCDGEKMLKYPELVRRMFVEGHTIGIGTMKGNGNFESAEALISDFQACSEILSIITKEDTRLYRMTGGSKNALISDKLWETNINKAGIKVWDWNINSRDQTLKAVNSVYDRVVNAIKTLETDHTTKTAVINLHSLSNTYYVVEKLIIYIKSMPQFNISTINETTKSVNFIGKKRID